MPDKLDELDTTALRAECSRRGIWYPAGMFLANATGHQCREALRSPEYAEAFRLGLLTPKEEIYGA